jgi:hypothetical protein
VGAAIAIGNQGEKGKIALFVMKVKHNKSGITVDSLEVAVNPLKPSLVE